LIRKGKGGGISESKNRYRGQSHHGGVIPDAVIIADLVVTGKGTDFRKKVGDLFTGKL
jgi:hypothetical protein